MMEDSFETLTVVREGAAAWVTIKNAPINVLDVALISEVNDFAGKAALDESLQVIVFQSADPDFFIVHGDMNFVKDASGMAALEVGDAGTEHLNPMMRLHERLRALPQVTIGKIQGFARGGGAEFLSALDMRFIAQGKFGLAFFETITGIIPGAGGTAYLPQLVGRARAIEIILGAQLFDAELAERYGWVNRVLPPEELDYFVDGLARSIASRGPGIVRAAKKSIDAGRPELTEQLRISNELLLQAFASPDSERLTLAALEAGAQTRDGEKKLEQLLAAL
jgi:enoyl-CoA hydratase/carnithine racemase